MTDRRAAHRGHFHAVRFYEDDVALCRIVADFVHAGLTAGQPAVIIATPAHNAGILSCLAQLSVDVGAMRKDGHLSCVEATAALAKFMIDGMPSKALFDTSMGEVLTRVSRGRPGTTIRAYGEMVDLLWQAGMHAAAIRLEMFWNQLANSYDFSLLCGYSMGSYYKDAAYEEICGEHTHIVSSGGEAAPLPKSERNR